jgi:hypothetical protein
LCEAKFGYIWNFIIYVGQGTAFDDFLGNEPYDSKAVLELMAPFSVRDTVTMDN